MSVLPGAALKKRRPPEGGLSLGRKRPKEGICDVSHRSNIALQRSKSKRIIFWHVSYSACQPCANERASVAAMRNCDDVKKRISKKGGRP
jgi:hypothetical protein